MKSLFKTWLEIKEQVSTFIFWNNKHQGKVGGAMWDSFIVNARSGHGQCYLIDGVSIADAKAHLSDVHATTIKNVFVYGDNAINVVRKQGGSVI